MKAQLAGDADLCRRKAGAIATQPLWRGRAGEHMSRTRTEGGGDTPLLHTPRAACALGLSRTRRLAPRAFGLPDTAYRLVTTPGPRSKAPRTELMCTVPTDNHLRLSPLVIPYTPVLPDPLSPSRPRLITRAHAKDAFKSCSLARV
eukprot:scaffold96997_cov49-Phaeocystis_antarctica.AAC.1